MRSGRRTSFQHTPVTGLRPRRRARGWRRDRRRPDLRRHRAQRGRRASHAVAPPWPTSGCRSGPIRCRRWSPTPTRRASADRRLTELLCYVSQTGRGQMLIGAEFDSQPSYSRHRRSASCGATRARSRHLLPFLRDLRILRQWAGICDIWPDYSPIMGLHRGRRLPGHHRLGDVGLQGDPRRRRGDGRADRHRPTPPLIATFALDRFAADHAMADQGSAGTR